MTKLEEIRAEHELGTGQWTYADRAYLLALPRKPNEEILAV